MKWKRIKPGVYETVNEKYRIERNEEGWWEVFQNGVPRTRLVSFSLETLKLAKEIAERREAREGIA